MIALAVISDRADLYFRRCLETLFANCDYSFDQIITVDDREHRLGLAGAVRAAWRQAEPGIEYIFHLEEDFEMVAPVPLDEMRWILENNPHLAQVVLKRQPWSPEEHAAGGIIELAPDAYTDCSAPGSDVRWVEHHRIFSLNPCLIPAKVFRGGWPDSNEAGMTARCLDHGWRFAFYGERHDPPRVIHVGAIRGTGWKP